MSVLSIVARVVVALLLLIGVLASGFSGLLVMAGLVLLVLAVQLLVTRRARWAFIPGPLPRRYGAGAIGAALLALIAAGAAGGDPTPVVAAAPAPTITRTTTATVTETATATETTTTTATITATPTQATAAAAGSAASSPTGTAAAGRGAPVPTSAPPPPPAPATTQAPPATQEPAAAYYANCTAVRDAGAAPIRAGDPGYSRKLDRDGDGIACET